MAVGETVFPQMPVIKGLRLGTTSAGIKKPGRRDLVVIEVPEGASVPALLRDQYRQCQCRDRCRRHA